MSYLSVDLKKNQKHFIKVTELCEDTTKLVSNFYNSVSSLFDLLPYSCRPVCLDCHTVTACVSHSSLLLLLPGQREKQHLWLQPLPPKFQAVLPRKEVPHFCFLHMKLSLREGHFASCPARTSSAAKQ